MGVGSVKPVTRLGLLGGTFDPIHTTHLAMADAARADLHLDRVLFVPAGDPWHKGGRALTSAAHRLAMVEAAVAGLADLAVSDLEIQRPGPTYTVDTLVALRAQGYSAIWLILGSDALADLPNWHKPGRLIALARLAVVRRSGYAVAPERLEDLLPGLAAVVDWVEMPSSSISATEIRARLRAGESVAGMVPPAVLAYIEVHGLYRDGR